VAGVETNSDCAFICGSPNGVVANAGDSLSFNNEKIFAKNPIINYETGFSNAVGDGRLYGKLLKNFIVEHGLDCKDATEAINEGRIDDAIRLAHTLKGTSALLGAERLRMSASGVETALASGETGKAKKRLKKMDFELTSAIDLIERLSPYLDTIIDSGKKDGSLRAAPEIAGTSATEAADAALKLISELKPLLISGNAECLSYADKIGGIISPLDSDGIILIDLIENFYFSEAAKTLDKIMSRLTAS
jgi:HPt (histidine-containing phosphotransfer) domain-containing protein